MAGDYKTEKGERVGDHRTEKGEKGGRIPDREGGEWWETTRDRKERGVRDYHQTEKGERVGDCGLPGSWRADALSWSVVHCIAHLPASS